MHDLDEPAAAHLHRLRGMHEGDLMKRQSTLKLRRRKAHNHMELWHLGFQVLGDGAWDQSA